MSYAQSVERPLENESCWAPAPAPLRKPEASNVCAGLPTNRTPGHGRLPASTTTRYHIPGDARSTYVAVSPAGGRLGPDIRATAASASKQVPPRATSNPTTTLVARVLVGTDANTRQE
jgi:hypothetical protein